MKIGQNCPKIKSCRPDKILNQKGREVSKMIKNHYFERKMMRNHKKWAKSDLKLAEHS